MSTAAAVEWSASAKRAAATDLGARLAGKYLTFHLAHEEYGLEILEVREIIGGMEITRAPQTRAFVRGVIDLRGQVIPVIDLRLKLGMERCEATDQADVVVVQRQVGGRALTMGLLVDQVREVIAIDGGQIEPAPSRDHAPLDERFLLDVGRHGKRLVLLLDLARILPSDEPRDPARASA